MKKILVDITHPAHVHFFKHAIQEWQARGHMVVVTSRHKDLTLSLLNRYNFEHTKVSRAGRGILGLSAEFVQRCRRLWRTVRTERPAVLTGVGGTFIAPVGKLTRRPVVLFTDTEHARAANAIAFRFADVICTPSCYEDYIGRKQVVYDGYQELAYLHPDRFTPDPSQLRPFGVTEEEPYIVMRLVAWSSGHDIGDSGFNNLEDAVDTLSQHGRVLISSESPLPSGLVEHSLAGAAEQIHHLLAFATLYIGESATMASESAILGVPSIFVSTASLGYINEQEREYGLICTFSGSPSGQQAALDKATALLVDPESKTIWQAKRDRMLADKIDVTAWLVDFVERYLPSQED